jgi:hypothetical protein
MRISKRSLGNLIRREYLNLLASATLGALFSWGLNEILTRWGKLEFQWVVILTIFFVLCATTLIYSSLVALAFQKRFDVSTKRRVVTSEKLKSVKRENERRAQEFDAQIIQLTKEFDVRLAQLTKDSDTRIAQLSKELNAQLAKVTEESDARLAQLAKQLDDMPDRFCALMSHNRDFHRRLWEYLTLRELSAEPNEEVEERRNKTWELLKKDYQALLESICNTAASVIDCHKQGGEPSCVNLKLVAPLNQLWPEYFASFGSDEMAYRVVCRSANAPSHRTQDDKRVNAESVLISRNYFYQQIMQKIENGDPPKEWYLLLDDMEKELDSIKKVRRQYSEPQDNAIDMYRSGLIVPVTNLAAMKQVIGFICIDSRQKSAFNTSYDLQFLQEFADNAAIATGLYFGALQLKEGREAMPS